MSGRGIQLDQERLTKDRNEGKSARDGQHFLTGWTCHHLRHCLRIQKASRSWPWHRRPRQRRLHRRSRPALGGSPLPLAGGCLLLLQWRPAAGFVRLLRSKKTCNVRPSGIHCPVPRCVNRLVVNILVFVFQRLEDLLTKPSNEAHAKYGGQLPFFVAAGISVTNRTWCQSWGARTEASRVRRRTS